MAQVFNKVQEMFFSAGIINTYANARQKLLPTPKMKYPTVVEQNS